MNPCQPCGETWVHLLGVDVAGGLAALIVAWAALTKARASYLEVGLKETARRGLRAGRRFIPFRGVKGGASD